MTKLKAGSTVYHVEFKSGGSHYFGSIAAIYEMFDPLSIGVKPERLYQFDIEDDKPYSNKICTISKGVIHRKKGQRSNPAYK